MMPNTLTQNIKPELLPPDYKTDFVTSVLYLKPNHLLTAFDDLGIGLKERHLKAQRFVQPYNI
jgi:hypothetical protein